MGRPRLGADALPVMSIRVAKGHQALVRSFVRSLRERPMAPVAPAVPLGIFVNEEAALRFVSQTLAMRFRPREIRLFGSRGRRDHRPDSDIDILVVLPEGMDTVIGGEAQSALAPGGLAVDVLACDEREFAEAPPGSIIEKAIAHGRRLFADRETHRREDVRQAPGSPPPGREAEHALGRAAD